MEAVQPAELLKACDTRSVGTSGGGGDAQMLQCEELCSQQPICCTGVRIGVASGAVSGSTCRNSCMENRER